MCEAMVAESLPRLTESLEEIHRQLGEQHRRVKVIAGWLYRSENVVYNV